MYGILLYKRRKSTVGLGLSDCGNHGEFLFNGSAIHTCRRERDRILASTSKCNAPISGIAMTKTYRHLSADERAVIMIERQNNRSMRGIVSRLDRSASSISRELRRSGTVAYDATPARHAYQRTRVSGRCRRLLVEGQPLYQFVHGQSPLG